jgi:hypothetical protein
MGGIVSSITTGFERGFESLFAIDIPQDTVDVICFIILLAMLLGLACCVCERGERCIHGASGGNRYYRYA